MRKAVYLTDRGVLGARWVFVRGGAENVSLAHLGQQEHYNCMYHVSDSERTASMIASAQN